MSDETSTGNKGGTNVQQERDFMEQLVTNLKQQRDELALQIHLGKEEAKEEWEKVQKKLAQLSTEFEPVKDAVEESAANVFESLKLVAGEIMESYSRIRNSVGKD